MNVSRAEQALGEEPFVVVAFTEPHNPHEPLTVWPQHMAITPWMQGARLQATNRIAGAVSGYGPLEANIDGEALFGAQSEIPAWTVEKTLVLQGLHEAAVVAGGKYGTAVEDKAYIGDAYRPHISKAPNQPEHEIGERLELSQLSIIGLWAGCKVVFETIRL